MIEAPAPTDAAPANPTKTAQNGAAPGEARDPTIELRNAFALGATISELQGRLRAGALNANLGAFTKSDPSTTPERAAFVPYVEADSDIAWTTSAWRVLFERLSLLHQSFFAESSTAKTRYDPGERVPPYFFPDEPSYADIGIAPAPAGKEILPNFKLCEVTRRGLNCLALLLINPEVSLLPVEVAEEQTRLIGLMANKPNPPATAASSNGQTSTPVVPSRDAAIGVIARALLMYLHAWEGYLRESFFAAGISRANENNLIAFEAGLSIVWLSWGITVDNAQTAEDQAKLWLNSFRDEGISRLQHQVAVLCHALDDARGRNDDKDSNKSRAAAVAVKRSLDYWQRAVVWLSKRPAPDPSLSAADQAKTVPPLGADDWQRLRPALIEQTGIWQALVLEQQSLDSFTARGVTQNILLDLASRFRQLATSQGIFDAATGVTKTMVDEGKVVATQIDAVAQVTIGVARRTMGAVLRSFWPVIVVLGVVFVIGLLVFVQHVSTGANGTLLADLTTPITAALGAGVLFVSQRRAAADVSGTINQVQASAATPTINAARAATPPGHGFTDALGGLTGKVETVAGEAGSAALAAFGRGFDKVQADLDEMGQSIGMSYPLVEYFVLNEAWKSFGADIDFMEQVVWSQTDRRNELVQVASAAFGPIGAFALITQSSSTPEASSTP